MSFIEVVGVEMGKAAVSELIKKTVGSAFDKFTKIDPLKGISRFKKQYTKYCQDILQVRTLTSPDISIYIDDFYVPLRLENIRSTEEIVLDQSICLTSGPHPYLIEGIAGQGKSTILRKLFQNNTLMVDRFSIFYELKEFQGRVFEEEIAYSLNERGININVDEVSVLLQQESVYLFLDGFDEVQSEKSRLAIKEVLRVAKSYNCVVISTARPESEVSVEPGFEKFKVQLLNKTEVVNIIDKFSDDKDRSKCLIEALDLQDGKAVVESVMSTPILVNLYCITYSFGEEIPTTKTEFYENIFSTLMYRHDVLKSGLKRERTWGDKKFRYESVFSGFCFLTQKNDLLSFSEKEAIGFYEDSLSEMCEEIDLAESVEKDVRKITNLVVRDGFNRFAFIHKSIQEYFSAVFVSKMDEEFKRKFYSKTRVEHDSFNKWANTLAFLLDIDNKSYLSYRVLPAYEELYGKSPNQQLEETLLSSIVEDIHGQLMFDRYSYGPNGVMVLSRYSNELGRMKIWSDAYVVSYFGRINDFKYSDLPDPGAYVIYQLNMLLGGSTDSKYKDHDLCKEGKIIELFDEFFMDRLSDVGPIVKPLLKEMTKDFYAETVYPQFDMLSKTLGNSSRVLKDGKKFAL